MSKTILIQTDFSMNSLSLVRMALHEHQDEQVSILLGHGYSLGNSISELLFFSRQKLLQSLVTDEFYAGLQMIKSKHSDQVQRLKIEFFTGENQAAFRNFLEANGVTESYLSPHSRFRNRSSFDLSPFIQKSNLLIREIAMSGEPQYTMEESESFADLFFPRMIKS